MHYKKTKKLASLDTATNSKNRDLIYGINTIEVLLNYDASRIITIFCEKKINTITNARIKKIFDIAGRSQISIQNVNVGVIDKWFDEHINHQGIAAHITPTKFLVEEDLIALATQTNLSKPLFLVLDNIQDPRNLGACIRNAAAFGISAVVISRNATCGITATVKKSASGAAEIVPIAKVGNLDSCLKQLQKQGVWVISLAASHAQNLSSIDLKVPIALVLGSEDKGVRNIIQQHSDFLAKIPMMDTKVDSLNLSVATGICLYEVHRQRFN